MVSAALHYGAPVKEVNLLHLYRKLADPEQCKFPLFYRLRTQSLQTRLNKVNARTRGRYNPCCRPPILKVSFALCSAPFLSGASLGADDWFHLRWNAAAKKVRQARVHHSGSKQREVLSNGVP